MQRINMEEQHPTVFNVQSLATLKDILWTMVNKLKWNVIQSEFIAVNWNYNFIHICMDTGWSECFEPIPFVFSFFFF